jgi:hypothetical protein
MPGPHFGPGSPEPSFQSQPAFTGLLQADFVYQENVDSGHPLNLDYFIPINCQTVKTARLSFKLRLYRSYSTITFSTTGATTLATDATGESGHTHSHTHGSHTHDVTVGTNNVGTGSFVGSGAHGITVNYGGTGGSFDTNATTPATDATGSSGHTHSHNHGSHTHTISGSTILGVAEDGNNNPSVSVLFDGVDQTPNISPAGPYTSDQIELDVTKFISTKLDRTWHTISFTVGVRARIQAVMRLLYNTNQV